MIDKSAPMAKVIIPQRPEKKHIRGFTPLKPNSYITSKNGNKFIVKSNGGVYVNGEGVADLEKREKDWIHYSDTVDQNISQYNEHVIKRNKAIEKTIDQELKPWWKKW
jgi:hypothetical protein